MTAVATATPGNNAQQQKQQNARAIAFGTHSLQLYKAG